MPDLPVLLQDADIKRTVAKALGRHWSPPPDMDRQNERSALREICVPCKPEDIVRLERRLPKADPAALDSNYLLSDIVVFCPIALPGWQSRAKIVLQQHVHHWRDELEQVRVQLQQKRMYAVPFGRFLISKEHSTWVSEVGRISVENRCIFQNCEGARIPPNAKSDIWFYSRPYIIWPVVPGTLKHITYVDGNPPLTISRPELKDPLLRQE